MQPRNPNPWDPRNLSRAHCIQTPCWICPFEDRSWQAAFRPSNVNAHTIIKVLVSRLSDHTACLRIAACLSKTLLPPVLARACFRGHHVFVQSHGRLVIKIAKECSRIGALRTWLQCVRAGSPIAVPEAVIRRRLYSLSVCHAVATLSAMESDSVSKMMASFNNRQCTHQLRLPVALRCSVDRALYRVQCTILRIAGLD